MSTSIEGKKASEARGGADNYTWDELLDAADEFCECGGRQDEIK